MINYVFDGRSSGKFETVLWRPLLRMEIREENVSFWLLIYEKEDVLFITR